MAVTARAAPRDFAVNSEENAKAAAVVEIEEIKQAAPMTHEEKVKAVAVAEIEAMKQAALLRIRSESVEVERRRSEDEE
jgi:hypothetical protein